MDRKASTLSELTNKCITISLVCVGYSKRIHFYHALCDSKLELQKHNRKITKNLVCIKICTPFTLVAKIVVGDAG